jgi:predicted small metal-binding protein
MKTFRCGDVVPGCTHAFTGDENAILAQVAEHARSDHGLTEIPDALVAQVRAAMTSV